jgi:hypothetical protein
MDCGFKEVYHASPIQGLTQIIPHVSTHGQSWVYATDHIAVAAVFLGRLGGDFTCASGLVSGNPYLCERFAGAVDRRYGSVAGSLYTLPGDGFLSEQTSYSKDLICSQAVKPLEEIRVANAKDYLLQLASDGKIIIHFYPERFCLRADDEDLVEKAARMYQQFGEGILEQIRDFHPGLLDRVMEMVTRSKI